MKSRAIGQWLEQYLAASALRANSMIITVYGDSIAPHGGTVWLGSFIRLVEPLGLNPRMVRTSVFRLSRENWLVAEQIGRRSYYSLTPSGRRRFEHAYRRIYQAPDKSWDGQWQIIFLGAADIASEQRESVRRDLLWQGFGTLAPGVLAHPKADEESVLELLHDAGVYDKVVIMRAASIGGFVSRPLQELARDCWNLQTLSEHYHDFLAHFRPVLKTLSSAKQLDPEQCFLVRTLMMHEYRRVLLRDPLLPDLLLPPAWPGEVARQICIDLYRITHKPAEQHLMTVLETAHGPLPPAAPYFFERFGGLQPPAEAVEPVVQ